MKLYYGPASPFVRKVMVAAIELGLDDQIELIPTRPWEKDTEFVDVNPLVKIPALITNFGNVIYDSPVIIDYFDTLHDGQKLVPASGLERYEVLRIAALADGMMDAAILLYTEMTRRPSQLRWNFWDERLRNTVTSSLNALERDVAMFNPAQPDLGQITTASGVGWLEYRLETLEIDFRCERPALSAWFDAFSERTSMKKSVPTAPPP